MWVEKKEINKRDTAAPTFLTLALKSIYLSFGLSNAQKSANYCSYQRLLLLSINAMLQHCVFIPTNLYRCTWLAALAGAQPVTIGMLLYLLQRQSQLIVERLQSIL